MAAAVRGGVGHGVDDELEIKHEKTKAPVPRDGFELERLVFIELERKAKAKREASVREQVVERLKQRKGDAVQVPVLSPELVKQEAIRSGDTGPRLQVQLAAALAVLASGAAASFAIPRVVRMVQSAQRGVGGGVGFRVNDAARIKRLLAGGAFPATGAGEFFEGTEG